MANKTLNIDKLQLRRDTAENWETNNPVLAMAEEGYETDTGLRKIGDGVTHWNDLGYEVSRVELLAALETRLALAGLPKNKRIETDENGDLVFVNKTSIVNGWQETQDIIRAGEAPDNFLVGGLITVNRILTCTAAVATGSAITTATVDLYTFIHGMGTLGEGVFNFTYVNGKWFYNTATAATEVLLSDFGIQFAGTPQTGDGINITTTARQVVLDILANNDYDTPTDPTIQHTVALQQHQIETTVVFDASEALYYVDPDIYPEGLPVGTYNVTLDHGSYANGTTQDGTYQFTTTRVIPAGGHIRHSSMGCYYGNSADYTKDKITAGKFITYTADFAQLEQLTTTEGNEGTNLGTATCKDPQYKVGDNINYTQRQYYGCNKWLAGAYRQWANSDKGSGWYVKQHKFDMISTTPASGYLYGLEPDFVKLIVEVKKRTALPTLPEGGGYVDSNEKVFALSLTEMGYGKNNGVAETSPNADGIPKETAYPYWVGKGNADRIKYNLNSAASNWWLRSPYVGYAYLVWYVNSSGAFDGHYAYYASGGAPGLCIG